MDFLFFGHIITLFGSDNKAAYALEYFFCFHDSALWTTTICGGTFRKMYGDFLIEAAVIMDNKNIALFS